MTIPEIAGRSRRLGIVDTAANLLALFVALWGFAYFIALFVGRPFHPAEAELVFEATRVGRGYPLYIDPWVGAWEYGGYPSRFYMLYTPLWPWLLGKLANGDLVATLLTGRAVSLSCWAVALAAPVLCARPDNRRTTLIAALLVVGTFFLSRTALSANPDAAAAAFTSLGLCRAARRGRIDAWSAAFLAVAPFLKPSAIGAVVGAQIALLASPSPEGMGWLRARILPLVSGCLTFIGLALLCERIGAGLWLEHLLRSVHQPATLMRWVEQFGARFPVLGLPHLIVIGVAIRRRASLVTTAPLIASVAWATFAMAKHGSGTQYWLEPTICALVSLAWLPNAASPLSRSAVSRVVLIVGAFVALISIPAYWAAFFEPAIHARQTAAIAARCPLHGDDVIVSDDVTLELELNGRILVPGWQSAFLAREGKFPLQAWRDDLGRKQVRCIVLYSEPHRVPQSNDERVEASPFADLLANPIDQDYVLDGREDGAFIYRPKNRDPAPPHLERSQRAQ